MNIKRVLGRSRGRRAIGQLAAMHDVLAQEAEPAVPEEVRSDAGPLAHRADILVVDGERNARRGDPGVVGRLLHEVGRGGSRAEEGVVLVPDRVAHAAAQVLEDRIGLLERSQRGRTDELGIAGHVVIARDQVVLDAGPELKELPVHDERRADGTLVGELETHRVGDHRLECRVERVVLVEHRREPLAEADLELCPTGRSRTCRAG